MASPYSSIIIIYNPNSTSGRAETKATRLTRQLKRRQFSNVKLRKSEYPGHSEVLAYDECIKAKNPLIVSVSGDGGYNEVINGALRAQESNKAIKPVCAILAAGNANDHRRAVAKRPLLRAIMHSKPEPMDILKLEFGNTVRYAHSYIGIGVTAQTVAALNVESLSRWKEVKIVTKSLFNFHHFTIKTEERTRKLDSLVFANIHRMSKVLRIGDKSDINNGLMSVVVMPHRTRLKFFYLLAKIALFGVKNPDQLSSYSFLLTKPQLCQLDGEPFVLPTKTSINIEAVPELVLAIR